LITGIHIHIISNLRLENYNFLHLMSFSPLFLVAPAAAAEEIHLA